MSAKHMTMQWWCLYFARVGVLFQGCVILSPSVVACPLHVNLGSRDERMASILSKNIDATNILSRVDICAEVSVGAILQDMRHDLGLSIVYMRHYPHIPTYRYRYQYLMAKRDEYCQKDSKA
jgi:hypothetical protein